MKLLLDAIYINESGGLTLLCYLIDQLIAHDVDTHYLLDARIEKLELVDEYNVTYLPGSEKARRQFYASTTVSFDHVLCFGNIPPTRRLKAKVYTFFQNVTLLSIPEDIPWKNRPKWLLKRLYIRLLKDNTDYWIVQTSNTSKMLRQSMQISQQMVLICPFFNDSVYHKSFDSNADRSDYSYIALYRPEKNHKMLIEAWQIILQYGFSPTLHLTIDNIPTSLKTQIDAAQAAGCSILNHGFCSAEDVRKLYLKTKAVVYTSNNESFGLGMIEAMNMGCDVIGPLMPYVSSICRPSESFRYDPLSLAKAIIRYETGRSPKTICYINNEIDRFISTISS